jgi:hypothetical protein
LSTLKRHNGRKTFKFGSHLDKPPIVLGLYWRGGYEIFLPFFLNKSPEFKIDHLKGRLEVVAYMSKTLPEGFQSRPILDLEVFALLTALYSMQSFISVRNGHGGGWSRKINAWHLYTLMVYL